MDYPDDLSIREARELYFSKSGFDASTYTDPWVKLPFLGFHFYLPNFSARRKAVPLHDIDHVLTEYKTDWLGEFEISSYELGTGCGRYWAGWFINSQGILPGVILAPRKLLHAFARGRRSQGVFGFGNYESLLSEKVGDLRRRTTAAHESVQPNLLDGLLFGLVVLTSTVVHLGPFVGLLWWMFR